MSRHKNEEVFSCDKRGTIVSMKAVWLKCSAITGNLPFVICGVDCMTHQVKTAPQRIPQD